MKPLSFRRIALTVALIVSTGVAHAAYTSYEEAISAARVQFNKGDYAGAQKTTEQALTLAKTPSDQVGGLLRLGLTYSQRKMYPQAREQWTRVLQLQEADAQGKLAAQSGIASSYGDESNWSACRTEFQKIVDNPDASPQDKATARLMIAGTWINQHNQQQAREAFSAIAEDLRLGAFTRALAYTQLGQSFLDDRQFEKARSAFAHVRSLRDVDALQSVVSQASIAKSYKLQGDATRAQQEYVKAQALAGYYSAAYSQANQLASGRALLELLLTFGQVPPIDDVVTRLQIGESLFREKQPAQARTQLQALIAKDYGKDLTEYEATGVRVEKQRARFDIANSYVSEGNKVQARETLQELLKLDQLAPGIQTQAQQLLKTLS